MLLNTTPSLVSVCRVSWLTDFFFLNYHSRIIHYHFAVHSYISTSSDISPRLLQTLSAVVKIRSRQQHLNEVSQRMAIKGKSSFAVLQLKPSCTKQACCKLLLSFRAFLKGSTFIKKTRRLMYTLSNKTLVRKSVTRMLLFRLWVCQRPVEVALD